MIDRSIATIRHRVNTWIAVALCLTVLAVATPAPARADITFYDIFKTAAYTQTSDAQPASPLGFFGSADVSTNNSADLTGATVTSSSNLSPMVLTSGDGFNYGFGSPLVATKATLDGAFPNGATYTFTLNGGTLNGKTETLSTPASDAYSATVPFFTNNTFTALQGVNAANAINLSFNPFATPNGVDNPVTFIAITEVSTGQNVFGTSGPNTLTGVTVAGGTLKAGIQYDLDIVYSARITESSSGFGTGTGFVAYDVRTDLIFTTAAASVPEPSPVILALVTGLAATARWRARRSGRAAA